MKEGVFDPRFEEEMASRAKNKDKKAMYVALPSPDATLHRITYPLLPIQGPIERNG